MLDFYRDNNGQAIQQSSIPAEISFGPDQILTNISQISEPRPSEPKPSQDTNIVSSINTDELKRKFVEKAKQQTISEEPDTSRQTTNQDDTLTEEHHKRRHHRKSVSRTE